MSLIRYEPFNFTNRLGLFEPFFSGLESGGRSDSIVSQWRPAVDVKEEDNRFVILADLPGVDPKDIEVTAESGMLTLKGERKTETREEKDGYKKVERAQGAFYRRFSLPDGVAAEEIAANGKNGVLEISIPKQRKAQPQRIEVSH